MKWIADPTIWAGIFTLTVLEIVLGIDNLVFITILVDRLPSNLRNKAKITGLTCALFIRIILLFSFTLLISLTNPIIDIWDHLFSVRDILMLSGGIFLLLKATMELNERLEGKNKQSNKQQRRKTTKFWVVVTQIIILDTIFSLDSVITAVGMVEYIGIVITAIIIAMILMIVASNPLTIFIDTHPTIIILCLSFLVMIGFNLVAEGFSYQIPKGYLYTAIGFSIIIELLNQFASFNQHRFLNKKKVLLEKAPKTVLKIFNTQHECIQLDHCNHNITSNKKNIFNQQEQQMIIYLLRFSQRNISSIMTPRHDIKYIDINKPMDKVLLLLENTANTYLVVIDKLISNEPIGIIDVIDIFNQQLKKQKFNLHSIITKPLFFSNRLSLLQALEKFSKAHTSFAFIVNEFSSVEGVVTLTDIIKTIINNIPMTEEK